jgi:hypothetical protein
LIVDNLEQ